MWIGPPPEAEMAAQMDHYRSYANEAATKNWTDDSLVHGDTPVAAAEALLNVLAESDCDTVNVRARERTHACSGRRTACSTRRRLCRRSPGGTRRLTLDQRAVDLGHGGFFVDVERERKFRNEHVAGLGVEGLLTGRQPLGLIAQSEISDHLGDLVDIAALELS